MARIGTGLLSRESLLLPWFRKAGEVRERQDPATDRRRFFTSWTSRVRGPVTLEQTGLVKPALRRNSQVLQPPTVSYVRSGDSASLLPALAASEKRRRTVSSKLLQEPPCSGPPAGESRGPARKTAGRQAAN